MRDQGMESCGYRKTESGKAADTEKMFYARFSKLWSLNQLVIDRHSIRKLETAWSITTLVAENIGHAINTPKRHVIGHTHH